MDRQEVPVGLFGFGKSKKTRIFFTTDVHGSTVVFKKFINAAKFYEAQIIILGGDMVGKMIVPLVEQPDHAYRANYLGKIFLVQAGEELTNLENTLENSGLYPLRVTPEEVKAFETDRSLVEQRFGLLAAERVAKWIQIAEERLKGTGVRCYVQPGNDDPYEIDNTLASSSVVLNVNECVVDIDDDHQMVSVGAANETPWHCPRDLPEEELTRRIEGTLALAPGLNLANAIFNLHVPPYDTNLDIAPELDETLTPKLSLSGGFKMIPVGSKAVREAIMKYQPLVSLHGHIHESRSMQKLGRTSCFNPGSEYGEGVIRGLMLDISKKGLENYMFTQG
jgi:Icc-related predicted phosphoesterase